MKALIAKSPYAYRIADILTGFSVSSVLADRERLKQSVFDTAPDLVFETRFDPELQGICLQRGIPCVFWLGAGPAPELFQAGLFSGGSLIFLSDRRLAKRLIRLGAENVYYEAVPMPEKREQPPGISAPELCERLLSGLGEPERRYLEGLMDAQRLVPEEDVICGALTDEILSEFREVLELPGREKTTDLRYLYGCCILRARVIREETDKIKQLLAAERIPDQWCVTRFDEAGAEGIAALREGRLLFSDGCGLPPEILETRDYIRYSDKEELVRSIFEMKKDPEEAAGIIRNGREAVSRYCAEEAAVSRMLDKAGCLYDQHGH